METIEINRLTLGSIFKVMLIGLGASVVPLFSAMGLLGTFGMPTLNFGGQPVIGIEALIMGPLQGITISLMLSVIASPFIALGLWVISNYTDITISVTYQRGEE